MAKSTPDNISGTDVLQAPEQKATTVNNPQPILKRTVAINRIFMLSNDKRKGTVDLDVEEDTIDPNGNKQRRMRLLRGAQSIWFDEQPPTVFPQSYVNKNIETLKFDRGVLIIPINQPLHIKAAELTMRNVANQKKYKEQARPKDYYFYEWNPAEQNKVAIKDENDVIRAMQIAATAPINEVIPHAKYLNIQFQDEMGVPFDEEALRTEYIRFAKNNAAKFIQSSQSPVVKTSFLVKNAVENGKIDLGKQPGSAYWHDGGFICTLPEGRDAIDYLVEFAMTYGEANTAFQNQLRELTT